MRTIKITDETHRKLTVTLGMLMAETRRLQTYDSTITALLTRSINLPKESIMEVEKFINENKYLGYITKEQFIRQAIRFYLKWKAKEYEYIEIPKEKYDKLNKAVKKMRMPYYNAAEFIKDQINKTLKQYGKFLEEKE
jgi:hypothetical protein